MVMSTSIAMNDNECDQEDVLMATMALYMMMENHVYIYIYIRGGIKYNAANARFTVFCCYKSLLCACA